MMDTILVPEPEESLPSLSVSNDQGILQWISSVDHKQIGIMYLWLSVLFLVVAGIEILLVRLQLAIPNNHFLAPEVYNQLFTMHGTTMIFFVAMPAIFGFTTYFVPLLIGANDMAFPRLNAFSFWTTFFGGSLLYFSFIAGGAPDAGWFNYAPLNQYNYSSSPGIDYYCAGLLFAGIGTVTASVNFVVTILHYRVPAMSLKQMPMFIWMILPFPERRARHALAGPAAARPFFQCGRRRVRDPMAASFLALWPPGSLYRDPSHLRHLLGSLPRF
jgi:cytochrome c oxidase subunit 1